MKKKHFQTNLPKVHVRFHVLVHVHFHITKHDYESEGKPLISDIELLGYIVLV
jgi:hypothetical protein